MPKILRIHNRLSIGGPIHIIAALTQYMSDSAESMLVVGPNYDNEEKADYLFKHLPTQPIVIESLRWSANLFKLWQAYRTLRQIIRDFKPDIVETHTSLPGWIGRLAAYNAGVKTIIHVYHGHAFEGYSNVFVSQILLQIERFLALKTTCLIAISPSQCRDLTEKFAVAPREKFEIVPLGIPLEPFSTDVPKKRATFRAAYNLSDDTIAIGIIGRLVPIKNHALFLSAAATILAKTDKKIHFFVVGDGALRENLEKSIDNIATYFTFTSWRKDIDVVLAGLDIVALTSLNEGTPVCLIEAQAAGKAIVSTRVGGVGDTVLENETAFLSDSDDDFIQKLLELIENEPLRKTFADNGNAFAHQKFSYTRLLEDMKKIYQKSG